MTSILGTYTIQDLGLVVLFPLFSKELLGFQINLFRGDQRARMAARWRWLDHWGRGATLTGARLLWLLRGGGWGSHGCSFF